MRVGIDLDGVLVDFNKGYIELIKELSGEDKFGPDFVPTTWNYPQDIGYSKEIVNAAWDRIKDVSDWWLNLDQLEGFQHFYDWFELPKQIEHEVYFITSRMGRYVKLQTETWLGERGIIGTVLISSEKGLCCKALNLDYYLDDKLENIRSCEKESPFCHAYILTQPWNKDADVDLRVDSVRGFLNSVD